MKQPKVSIIVPIYNVERYLDRCMHSLLNQTMKDIEIIMVDDGSPDNSPKMCDEYAKKDKRVKVIHKQNGGLGYARNSGLEIATGEYIAFVDSDDYVKLDMYEKLYDTAMTTRSDTVFCGFNMYFEEGRVVNHQHTKGLLTFKDTEVKNLMLDFIASSPEYKSDWKYEMSVWHGIYSTGIIQKHNLRFISEREFLSEDLPFQVRYLKESATVAYMPDCFYYYCMNNAGSLTHANYSPDKLARTQKLIAYLSDETKLIDGADLRIKRFFICYLRALLYGISGSSLNYSIKKKYALELCDENIWKKIEGYPYTSLGLNSQAICFMQRHRLCLLSLVYAKLITEIKKIKTK